MGIKIVAYVSFFFSEFDHAFDGRSDRQTDISLVAKTALHTDAAQ